MRRNVTSWGNLWFAKEVDGENRVMGITPEGEDYKFATNRVPDPTAPDENSEFAGPIFSPGGETFGKLKTTSTPAAG